MTSARRVLVIPYLLAVVGMCLWVPWRARYQGTTVNAGYAPVWRPPKVLKPEYRENENLSLKSIDLVRWALPVVACSAAFGVAFLLLPWARISNLKIESVTRKQVALIAGTIVLASMLSAVLAYRLGFRRGAPSARATSVPADIPEGPCVPFAEAGPLVGKTACVSGRVLKVFTSKPGNTFLDFCQDYKTCPFMSVIFSQDREKFGDLGQLQGRRVEIRGLVSYYQSRAEIIVRDPGQIQVAP